MMKDIIRAQLQVEFRTKLTSQSLARQRTKKNVDCFLPLSKHSVYSKKKRHLYDLKEKSMDYGGVGKMNNLQCKTLVYN